MILGTKVYEVRIDPESLAVDAYRQLDADFMKDKYSQSELASIRDVQILDYDRDFGFIYRKVGLANAPGTASLDFFIRDEHDGSIRSYEARKFQVGSDLIDEQERVLFENYQFGYSKP